MKLETLVSDMMKMNVLARLWHWSTDVAQHHVTFEQFLTQNETFTDSLVESALGNDLELNITKVGVIEAVNPAYSIEFARKEISNYRERVSQARAHFDESNKASGNELVAILDGAIENASKTLYLLKLK